MSVAASLMMLSSTCLLSRNARACVGGVYGQTSFTASPGGSQTLTWTAYSGGGINSTMTVSITAGSDVFTVSQMPVSISGDSATFTITFNPGANATGIFKGTLKCPCGEPYELVGTVAESGVANTAPSNVSFTITPNPATDYVNIISNGARSAEIGIYDLLGKEVTSSKTMNWELDASSFAPGAYIARITGESLSGDPFVISRRIIIER